jgi:hypothetical protein
VPFEVFFWSGRKPRVLPNQACSYILWKVAGGDELFRSLCFDSCLRKDIRIRCGVWCISLTWFVTHRPYQNRYIFDSVTVVLWCENYCSTFDKLGMRFHISKQARMSWERTCIYMSHLDVRVCFSSINEYTSGLEKNKQTWGWRDWSRKARNRQPPCPRYMHFVQVISVICLSTKTVAFFFPPLIWQTARTEKRCFGDQFSSHIKHAPC